MRSVTVVSACISSPDCWEASIMKCLGAMLACLVMLGLSGLASAQSTGMDGDFWVSQTRSGKSNYLDGFSDGMELGHYISVWKNLEDASKADAVNSAREAYSEY